MASYGHSCSQQAPQGHTSKTSYGRPSLPFASFLWAPKSAVCQLSNPPHRRAAHQWLLMGVQVYRLPGLKPSKPLKHSKPSKPLKPSKPYKFKRYPKAWLIASSWRSSLSFTTFLFHNAVLDWKLAPANRSMAPAKRESPGVGPLFWRWASSKGILLDTRANDLETIWKHGLCVSVKIGDGETQFLLILESISDSCIYRMEVSIFVMMGTHLVSSMKYFRILKKTTSYSGYPHDCGNLHFECSMLWRNLSLFRGSRTIEPRDDDATRIPMGPMGR